jgi:hypothetical protein
MKMQGADAHVLPTIVEWNAKTDSIQSVVDKVFSEISGQ